MPRKDGDEPKMEGRAKDAKGHGSERQFEEVEGVEGVEGKRSEDERKLQLLHEGERKPFKAHSCAWEIDSKRQITDIWDM